MSLRIVLTAAFAGAALLAALAAPHLGLPAVLLLAVAGGWLLAGWATRPVNRLAARLRGSAATPAPATLAGDVPKAGRFAEVAGLAEAMAAVLAESRAATARLLTAQEASGSGYRDADLRTGRQVWSRQQFALYGLDPDGPVPDPEAWARLLHPDDLPGLQAAEAAAAQAVPPVFTAEFRIRRADDGAERWIATAGRIETDAEGRPSRRLGIDRDITARRQREADLALRERSLRAMVEANPIGVLRGDVHGRIHDANDALLRIIGRSRAELAAGTLRWDRLTPPDWAHADAAAIATVQATGRCEPYEKEYWRPDGGRIPVLVGFTIIGEDGTETIAFILDLSERKRAERALLQAKQELEQRVAERTASLAEREAQLRHIYDRTPAALHSCDQEGRLIEVSAEWLRFLGYAREEVLGRRPTDFMTADSAARWDTARQALQRSQDETHDVEYRMVRRDGGIVEVLLRARADTEADGRFRRSYAVLVDITERNRAEARLREAQKLEALGRIAGGVAHDFNNMLQVVNGALRLLQNRPDDPARVSRYAAAALEAAERGASVTRRMLAFARRDQLQSGPVVPAAVLDGLATLLHGTLGPDIRLEIAADPGLPPLRADRMQLDLVLFNLALNARDAMPAGGVLRLEARQEAAGVPAPDLLPGRYLRLTVGDTGEGMDAETLRRATEPFFTTKEVGQGTGLGLAMAHGFAVQSGGSLGIESTPGHGTTVTLWLPEATDDLPAMSLPGPAAPRRALRVLMVEDEGPVRHVLAAALREEGLAVTEAETAAAALALLDAGGRFDVVLTDYAMPGMSGTALAAELARRSPGLPVAILSGNAGQSPADAPQGVVMLRKPVGPAELAARLRQLA